MGVEGYQGEDGRQYVIRTEHKDSEVRYRDNNKEGLSMENQFFDLHSHPAPDGTKGGSGYGRLYGGD